MSTRMHLMLVRAGLAAAALAAFAGPARAAGITSNTSNPSATIVQTSTLPLTTTDFGSGGVAGNPLTFDKFDTQDDTRILDSVTLTVNAQIRNEFGMKFYTPATITTSTATGDASKPGPSITMYQPDGKTPLLTAAAPNDPSVLTRSVTYGFNSGESMPREFSSKFDPTSPYYLAPAVSQKTETLKLTNPADLALFTGTDKISLPVAGSAWAKITSSSGNGYGDISTKGSADVTVTYEYHDRIPAPQTVPEPASVAVWGLIGSGLAFGYRRRARRAV